jgi:hypothetical protein
VFPVLIINVMAPGILRNPYGSAYGSGWFAHIKIPMLLLRHLRHLMIGPLARRISQPATRIPKAAVNRSMNKKECGHAILLHLPGCPAHGNRNMLTMYGVLRNRQANDGKSIPLYRECSVGANVDMSFAHAP